MLRAGDGAGIDGVDERVGDLVGQLVVLLLEALEADALLALGPLPERVEDLLEGGDVAPCLLQVPLGPGGVAVPTARLL